ncbi:stalk domain-containing protein [Paenibacillus sp. y28]|uniref:stalk domain-containing protein n=1 Tax=Paenibacillus sp. y28 TaxID=3129110 RepID=UPI003015B099
MKKKHLLSFTLALAIAAAQGQAASAQVSGTTLQLQLLDKQLSASVNGSAVSTETAAQIVDGSFYIPLRWTSQQLGLETKWNEERMTAGLTTPNAYLEWDLARQTVSVNGSSVPLEETSLISDGVLLVKLSWIAPYLQVNYAFQSHPARVDLTYVQPTDTAYRESGYSEDLQRNSRPIAVFVPDKPFYRLGEPVSYIDLSYDPDAEGLPEYKWSGNKPAFFEPGTYTVSLQVRDGNGNWSDTAVQTVKVTDEPYLSKAEFPWYTSQAGSVIREASSSGPWEHTLAGSPPLLGVISSSKERKRISSGENQVIRSTGMLGQQALNGKARLTLHHSNGMHRKVNVATVLYNPDSSKTRTVQITREGLLQPTILHQANAREAAVNFITQPGSGESIEVKPGQTAVLDQVTLEPGQGFAAIQDIETDGQAEIGFVVFGENEIMKPYSALFTPSVTKAVYEASEIHYEASLDRTNLPVLSTWTPGLSPAEDRGMVYSLNLKHPRPSVIALRAKEGYVNGIVRVNGQVLALPQGGLTDQDGAFVVYRAEGLEPDVKIEWLAAPGTTSAVEWIFYPLDERSKR